MTLWRVRHGFDTTVEAATEEEARNIAEQAYEQYVEYVGDEPDPLLVEKAPYKWFVVRSPDRPTREWFETEEGDSLEFGSVEEAREMIREALEEGCVSGPCSIHRVSETDEEVEDVPAVTSPTPG
ncbi:MAG TPA: hypothetical protein VGG32_05975 [Thermoplasmata archaeon]|jgi:predicted RNase H-like HicB family nuclease